MTSLDDRIAAQADALLKRMDAQRKRWVKYCDKSDGRVQCGPLGADRCFTHTGGVFPQENAT